MRKLLLLLILFISGTSQAQTFDETLDAIAQDHNIVGMAVGVSCEGEVLVNYQSGLKNIDLESPLTTDTKFRVASISKSFTAAGLLSLYDQELFLLDDDISESLGYTVRNPDFPSNPITYRMLLSHTSSLQDGDGYNPFLSATFGNPTVPSISEVLLEEGDYYTQNMWRTEEPGTYFAYSNLNYGLIGTLIESLSGQRFDVYMREQILEPLNITGSYNVNDLSDINELSALYRNGVAQQDNYGGVFPPPLGDGYTAGTNGSLFGPQGSLRCSAAELMRFGQMLLNDGEYEGNQILAATTVELMLSEQWNYNGSNGDDYFGLFRNWGLGVHRSEGEVGFDKVFENTLMIGHPGEAYGLISDLYFEPESELVLVFISNGYYSGGNYAFAENSIFYAPEEETFEAIESEFFGNCTILSRKELARNLECIRIENGQIIAEFDSEISIIRMDGVTLASKRNSLPLSSIPKGLHLVYVRQNETSCIQKVFLKE